MKGTVIHPFLPLLFGPLFLLPFQLHLAQQAEVAVHPANELLHIGQLHAGLPLPGQRYFFIVPEAGSPP